MHVGQRIGQAARREDPGRHRLFQKRRERSARAVMVPKTPGEKPPGPTLSQAQAGAGSGRSPGVREIFGFCASSSWKKRSAKRSVEGEEAGSDQGNDLLQARPLRRSVRGSLATRRDSRRGRPLCRAAATSMAVDRRWALDVVVQRRGRLPCGEPHRARARRDPPRRARDCQRHRSAWRWGVGSGAAERGVGTAAAGRGRGQQRGAGPYPLGLAAANH